MESRTVLQERGGWWEDVLTNRCAFPIAPVNTFSNLGYVAAGVLAAVYGKHLLAGVVYGVLLTLLGVGSALYHGTKQVWASHLDNAGMYAVFTGLVTYTLAPSHKFIGLLMLAIALISAWRLAYSANWKFLLDPLMGVFVAISTLGVALNGSLLLAAVSLGTFGIAYIIWWADKNKTFWLPKFGHGIWHVLTAAALLMLFLGI